jgi:hypothetical protein
LSILLHWQWTQEWHEREELVSKKKKLEAEAERIRKRPQAKRERIEKVLRPAYEEYTEQSIAHLSRRMADPRSGHGTFRRLQRPYSAMDNLPYVPAEWFKRACELMPEAADAISDAERAKQLGKLEPEIEKIDARIKEIDRPEFFIHTFVNQDCRQELIQAWRSMQLRCNAPCTLDGLKLSSSPKEEQEAWGLLGLKEYVNKKTGKSPAIF